ncbi:MAG: ribonuclease HII [Candidatus Thorarchaeota archaeon]|nr:ribonuclease HII [Candidatus Thorarchaeota archaeon]
MSVKKPHELIAGIDEAGRGPVIGPLVVCGIAVSSVHLSEIEQIGVKDSKCLTPRRREVLALQIRKIADHIVIRSIPALQIDSSRGAGVSLNSIEADAFASVVRELHPTIAYMDAADVNSNRFARTVAERSGLSVSDCQFIAEHRADSTYPIVSAASIIAKVIRDTEIQRLHEIYGDFGSGYPSDPKTIAFVRSIIASQAKLPQIVRKSWKSIERITMAVHGHQATIEDF